MLGGRAAEEIVYGTKTTGAESDIEQATGLARRTVTRWGMSDRLGLVQLAPRENPYLNVPNGYGGTSQVSEETAQAIDKEILRIINEGYEEAKRLLIQYRKQLDALAEALVARETLNEQEILQVTGLPRARFGDGQTTRRCAKRSSRRETGIARILNLSPGSQTFSSKHAGANGKPRNGGVSMFSVPSQRN
jgi:hypothetical protein